MKKLLLPVLCFFAASQLCAQKFSSADLRKIKSREDSLRTWAYYMITDSFTEDRLYSDSIFTKTLVRALQVKNSFYYPFDSVLGISKLYAPDSSFRIFTWNVEIDDYRHWQRGAIQFPTRDGSLKLVGLHDFSDFSTQPFDSARTKQTWIGAIYYNIIQTEYKGKKYYTLFGLDHNSVTTTKKWVEVMHFNQKNEPVFGGPFFTFENDSIPSKPKYRIGLEYKKNARVLVNFIPEMDIILVDHLVSPSDQPDLPSTLVPDGDNEGYKWENGKWVHIDKVFTFKLQDGQAPVDDPLLDVKGNKDEKKLQQKTDKNKTKENRPLPNYDN